MYTQCPKCQTVFRITLEQLQAHNGLVRCGQCEHLFNADQQLFEDIPEEHASTKKPRAAGNDKPKSGKAKPAATPARKTARAAKKAPETRVEKIEAVPAKSKPTAARAGKRRRTQPIPHEPALDLEQLWRRPPPRRFSFAWVIGTFWLIVLLLTQSAYFYRDQLAGVPALRPYVIEVCAQLGCTLQPPYDIGRIELVQPTNIAPHPRYLNALRLRATLVNRAPKAQPHPWLHVTLTDRTGRVLARRTFAPAQYLEQGATAARDMPPHLAVSALLDLANPGGEAVGYQLDFSPPPIQ